MLLATCSRQLLHQGLRLLQVSGIKSFGRAKKGGYSFLCSRRIILQDSEDISLSIFTVGQPANLGNSHLRESNCSPMSRNFRGDIVNRRDIDRADISDHRVAIDRAMASQDCSIDARLVIRAGDD